MKEIRLLQGNEWEKAILLSDLTFREREQSSMGIAFPQVFSPGLHQSYGMFVEKELVAFMGLVPAILRIGPAKINVYSLGSVCTARDHRGKGYASLIFEHVKQHVELSGASLLLVSGNRSLYEKNNCYSYGTFTQFTLNPVSASAILKDDRISSELLSFREMEQTDWFRLKQLAESRTVAFEQSIWDLANLIHSEALASNRKLKQKVLVAEKQGQMVAFCIVALSEVQMVLKEGSRLVEWAGDPNAAAALLAYTVERYNLSHLLVNVAWYEEALAKAIAPATGSHLMDGFTICIIDAERLLKQVFPFFQQKEKQLSKNLQISCLENGNFYVRLKEQSAEFTAKQMVSLFFDYIPQIPITDNGQQSDDSWKLALQRLFPIPIPHAAGLNYV